MNAIQLFNFEAKEVRVVMNEETQEFWWVAKDVCDFLGLSNSRKAISSLDESEKGVTNSYTLGGNQDLTIVNESGLYHLIFKSRKPQAERFRKWVTSEVLPSIRKTGSYGIATEATEQLSELVESLENRLDYLENKELQRAYEEEEKALPSKLITVQEGIYKVAFLAEWLEISIPDLYTFMRGCGYVSSEKDNWNLPTERSLDAEWLIALPTTYKHDTTKKMVTSLVTRVTHIGFEEIYTRYKTLVG